MGESWHNNHHAFPASALHGLYPGQLDIGFQFVRLLERARPGQSDTDAAGAAAPPGHYARCGRRARPSCRQDRVTTPAATLPSLVMASQESPRPFTCGDSGHRITHFERNDPPVARRRGHAPASGRRCVSSTSSACRRPRSTCGAPVRRIQRADHPGAIAHGPRLRRQWSTASSDSAFSAATLHRLLAGADTGTKQRPFRARRGLGRTRNRLS